MSELCLGTYLQILYNARNEDKTNTKVLFVGEILSLITNDFDPGNTAMSKLFTGINNPTNVLVNKVTHLTEEGYRRLVDDFRNIIMPMLNPNRLSDAVRMLQIAIAEDQDIKQDTEIDLITGLKKSELKGTIDNQVDFFVGVFLYVLRYTRNPGKSKVVGSIMEHLKKLSPGYEFAKSKRQSIITSEKEISVSEFIRREDYRYNEQIEQEAIAFCIKYDTQKDWIPLCQIAQITNSTKKHSRKMFNDFCKCTRSVQQKILDINNIKKLELFGDNWWYKYLAMFEDDYRKHELGAERYVYTFTEYFPRLLNYGDASVRDFTQQRFPRKIAIPNMNVFPENYQHDIEGLIDEYIFYKEYDEYKSIIEPPMNLMWRELNFGGCSELVLTSFLALFIIGTCLGIPRPKRFDNKMVAFSGPGSSEVKTAEDLFYQALLTLYETYD